MDDVKTGVLRSSFIKRLLLVLRGELRRALRQWTEAAELLLIEGNKVFSGEKEGRKSVRDAALLLPSFVEAQLFLFRFCLLFSECRDSYPVRLDALR
jgi:hypothetical protein